MNAAYLMALRSLPIEYVVDGVHVADMGKGYIAIHQEMAPIWCNKDDVEWTPTVIHAVPDVVQKYMDIQHKPSHPGAAA